jgi:hypothetical protein
MPDIVETESFFPVKGETPMCSEICVCVCVGEFDQRTMHHSIDTYTNTQHVISVHREFCP